MAFTPHVITTTVMDKRFKYRPITGYQEIPSHEDFIKYAKEVFYVFPYDRAHSERGYFKGRWNRSFLILLGENNWRKLFWNLIQNNLLDILPICGWTAASFIIVGGIIYGSGRPGYYAIGLIPVYFFLYIVFIMVPASLESYRRWWALAERFTAECIVDKNLYETVVRARIFPLLPYYQPFK